MLSTILTPLCLVTVLNCSTNPPKYQERAIQEKRYEKNYPEFEQEPQDTLYATKQDGTVVAKSDSTKNYILF